MRHTLRFAAVICGLLSPCAASAQGEAASSTILIGQSVALSGGSKELGTEIRAGALAWFEHINKRGGVHGRKLVLETLDDGFDAARASANYRKLIEERNSLALLGCVGGATCSAAVPIVSASKVPFIGPANGNEVLRKPFNRYIFNVRASFADEVEHIIDHLTTVGINRIAVVYPNDGPGKAALATAEAALKRQGLVAAAAESYPRGSEDVAAGVKTVAKAEPAAVLIFGPYKVSAKLITELKKLGQEPQFMTLSVVGPKALAAELGDAGRGVGITQVVPYPFVSTIALVREYQEIYVRGTGAEPSFTSLEAFLAAKVLVEGLRRSGPQPTREKLVSALESMHDHDLGGFVINYTPANHDGSKYVDITVIGKDRKILR
jgi:ABC-type branched-subunit amino acid transport system substrate-binding protein